MQFGAQNRLSGLAGVNRYSADASVSKQGSISIGPPIATKMAGPPEAMAIEDKFLQALTALTRIEWKGRRLKLTSADRKTRLELTR
jgi:heat shock protein HslJ